MTTDKLNAGATSSSQPTNRVLCLTKYHGRFHTVRSSNRLDEMVALWDWDNYTPTMPGSLCGLLLDFCVNSCTILHYIMYTYSTTTTNTSLRFTLDDSRHTNTTQQCVVRGTTKRRMMLYTGDVVSALLCQFTL